MLSFVAAALAGLTRPAAGQHELEASTSRHVVSGRVLEPDGSPAAGAVVVTSAGGSALTGMDGSFELVVALPLDAESIEVTAVAHERTGSRSLVASARIVPAALSPTTPVGTLALTPSLDCYSRWQPTFGGKQGPNGDVTALAVFDDGGGPALFAGGVFNNAGGVPARRIARWDGATWSALGKGLDGDVATLLGWDDGNGPALYAGGWFIGGPSNDSYLAKWGCRPKATVQERKF